MCFYLLSFIQPEPLWPDACGLPRRLHHQHGQSASRGKVLGATFKFYKQKSFTSQPLGKPKEQFQNILQYLALETLISTWNFQNARILQCKWRGGANDQEVVQVSMKNLTGLQVPKTKFTFELQMFGAKTYSETRKTREEPFVENWMGTTLVLRFLLKSRPSQAKIHNIMTSGLRSLHKSKKIKS